MFNTRRTEEQRKMFNYQSNRLLVELSNFTIEPSNLLLEPSNCLFESTNFTIKPNSLISIDPRNLLVFEPDNSTVESKNSLFKSNYAKSSISGLTFIKDSYRN